MCWLGLSMKRWYCAWALWTRNSSPPFIAIPYCPSGAHSSAMSSRWCCKRMALLMRRMAVPIDIGRFLFRFVLSL